MISIFVQRLKLPQYASLTAALNTCLNAVKRTFFGGEESGRQSDKEGRLRHCLFQVNPSKRTTLLSVSATIVRHPIHHEEQPPSSSICD